VRDRHNPSHYAGDEGCKDVYELYDLVNDREEREDLYLGKQSIS
jgi:hypothetical protein